jgi:hypothetical protein
MQKEIDTLISQGQIDAEVVFLDKELHSNYIKQGRNPSGFQPTERHPPDRFPGKPGRLSGSD